MTESLPPSAKFVLQMLDAAERDAVPREEILDEAGEFFASRTIEDALEQLHDEGHVERQTNPVDTRRRLYSKQSGK